jgi:hypothetical protein
VTSNDKLKSNTLRGSNQKLQTKLSTDLYSFIATVKLNEGESFHDLVDIIFKGDLARRLKEFWGGLVVSFGRPTRREHKLTPKIPDLSARM